MDSRFLDNYNAYYRRMHAYNGVYAGTELMVQMKENGEYLSSACAQFAKRDFLLSNGIAFYNGILHEDELYTFCSMLVAQRVGYLDRVLYQRRLRKGSIMGSKLSFEDVYGYFISYLEMKKYCERRGLVEDENEPIFSAVPQMLKTARNKYFQLSEAERYAFWGLPVQMQCVFERLIVFSAPLPLSGKIKFLLKKCLQAVLQNTPQGVLLIIRQKTPQVLLKKLRQWKDF